MAPTYDNPWNSSSWWVVALAIAALAVVLAHARRYYSTATYGGEGDPIQILQTRLEDATPELLAERRPLVIEDRLVDPATDLLKTLFRMQYVWKSRAERCPDVAAGFGVARARFTLVFFLPTPTDSDAGAEGGDFDVVIRRPAGRALDDEEDGDGGVAVRLAPGRTLVLPPRWRYATLGDARSATQVRLHDSISVLLNLF